MCFSHKLKYQKESMIELKIMKRKEICESCSENEEQECQSK